MTVAELRRKLERAIYILDDYKDNDKIKMVSNTYFLDDCRVFLGIGGYNGGYINLENPVEESEEDEEA